MDNRYHGRPCEQSPHDHYGPMPTYNLWATSPFYRESEFIPRHFYTMSPNECGGSQTSFPPEEEREITRDIYNRRVIQKDSLYTNPDLFNGPEKELDSTSGPNMNPPQTEAPQSSRDEWTDSYWRRAGVSSSIEYETPGNSGSRKLTKGKGKDSFSKPFRKNFMQAIAQPLKSSIAESMMQKMGWQGGALGRGGNGIVEPIAPNIEYAQKTIGFGRVEPAPPKKAQKKQKMQKVQNIPSKKQMQKKAKEDFITNALLHILEFVRNDWENEVTFDPELSNKERAVVHQCVNELINSNEVTGWRSLKITTYQQEQALADIKQYNTYVLYTESQGVVPLRQLCLYKDAPEHVYLVTPDDFKDDPEDEVIEDKEDNPFLKSIKRSLDPEDDFTEPGDRGKLIKFFLEFIRDDSFTEFRFLGPFNREQAACLSRFVDDVSDAITSDDDGDGDDGSIARKLRRLFSDEAVSCELVENCNGSMVIHKHKRENKT